MGSMGASGGLAGSAGRLGGQAGSVGRIREIRGPSRVHGKDCGKQEDWWGLRGDRGFQGA